MERGWRVTIGSCNRPPPLISARLAVRKLIKRGQLAATFISPTSRFTCLARCCNISKSFFITIIITLLLRERHKQVIRSIYICWKEAERKEPSRAKKSGCVRAGRDKTQRDGCSSPPSSGPRNERLCLKQKKKWWRKERERVRSRRAIASRTKMGRWKKLERERRSSSAQRELWDRENLLEIDIKSER